MTAPGTCNTKNAEVTQWVADATAVCQPERIYWCDGSEEEKRALTAEAVERGVLIPLSPKKLPGCYLHRSNPNDVARSEQATFICTKRREDAGPTNNWAAPSAMRQQLQTLCEGGMRGRTMYVVPYLMGPPG